MSEGSGPGGAQASPQVERGLDLDRVVFFSDAVFAISITVLTLSLRLPTQTTDRGVADALHRAIPSIVTYVLSFVVVGLFWIAHHRMFRYITGIDAGLMRLNLVVLLVVAFTPFPTSVLGDHGNTTAAVVFYAATMTLLGLVSLSLWVYATHGRRLIRPSTPEPFIRHSFWRAASVPVVFAASIPIAFVNPFAAEWFWMLIVISRIVLRRLYGSLNEA